MKPACMDIAEYAAWTEKDNQLRIAQTGYAQSPCDDCLTGFALEMREAHKCYAWNGERFVLGEPLGYEEDPPADDIIHMGRLRSAQVRATARRKRALRVFALVDGGMSTSEAARACGLSYSAAQGYIRERRMGVAS